jgi:hypothetical protein
MDSIEKFCNLVRVRSSENRRAISVLVDNSLLGNAMSVLRQELDSMVRAIYLLSCAQERRADLIIKTLQGQKWNITDRDMVNLSQNLHGWTESVYKFGCAFIHLSEYHAYASENPFLKLGVDDINNMAVSKTKCNGIVYIV